LLIGEVKQGNDAARVSDVISEQNQTRSLPLAQIDGGRTRAVDIESAAIVSGKIKHDTLERGAHLGCGDGHFLSVRKRFCSVAREERREERKGIVGRGGLDAGVIFIRCERRSMIGMSK
jgi:hypothetical protein